MNQISTVRGAVRPSPKPSSASTVPASTICATVFALLTASGLMRDGMVEKPRQHDRGDDEDVARDDGDDEPGRQLTPDAQRDEDRDEQQLVGERIEIGAELRRPAEALGEKAVDAVRDARDDEGEECRLRLSRNQEPENDRHQDDPAECDEIGDIQGGSACVALCTVPEAGSQRASRALVRFTT